MNCARAMLAACCLLAVHPLVLASQPFTLTSEKEENRLGEEAYQEILKEEKVSQNQALNAYVERVAKRIIAAAPPKDFKWEITVLESDKVNAFVLPGGKICVYTAILPYCKNEAGLATVLGHECAHAILRHGGQRMTQQTVVGVLGAGLDQILKRSEIGALGQTVAKGAYGYGAQLGILLPYSRSHETEADEHGLVYMAKAGYDPAEASAFWERFAAMKQGSVPTFLSSHPSDTQRAQRLKDLYKDANRHYQSSPKYGLGDPIPGLGEAGTQTAAPAAEADVSATLREALGLFVARALFDLGKKDGFQRDLTVRVLLPVEAEALARAARARGKGDKADAFALRLNRAAENVAREAKAALEDELRRLDLSHAEVVLNGSEDAATMFFARAARRNLVARLKPVARMANTAAGTAGAYEELRRAAGAGTAQAPDFDAYLANQALGGIFYKMGDYEYALREHPEREENERVRRLFISLKTK